MHAQIPNWGADLSDKPMLSVVFVNGAIQAHIHNNGPLVQVGIERKGGLHRVTEVRSRYGQPQGKLLSTGKWVNISGVILQSVILQPVIPQQGTINET